ncbi:hypothetical protein ACS0TY_035736 [Phlomoides rotata]
MKRSLLSVPDYFSSLLHKCMKQKVLKPCKQIHGLLLTNHVGMNSLSLSSKLIGAYACSGDLISSKLIFQKTPFPNVFAFNWMIQALISSGSQQEAIGYFPLMQQSRNNNSSPNRYTFSAILKGCRDFLDVILGKQFHCLICKMGFEEDPLLCNALIDMYGKCRKVYDARQVFDKMSDRDIASWTTMICGYADVGEIDESVALFERMRLEGVEPNAISWTAIIAGHARSGDSDGALEFLSRMGEEGLVPDLVTWNAMISGFVQSEKAIEALQTFKNMLTSGIKPNEVTVTGLLPSCGTTGSMRRGKEIHGLIYRMQVEINAFVGSALIDMYSNCGSIRDAQNVFNTSSSKNVGTWNAMIGCYGKHGMVNSAIELFGRMKDEEIEPNEVTLTSVLCACSHGGVVEKGMEIFKSMEIEPNEEHYSCLVDLLCRYGRIEEAYRVVKEIGVEVMTDSIIGAFLNGCKIHERRDLAEKIGEYVRMEMKKSGSFVTLSNIYALGGEWGGVEDVREVMKDKRICKKPGFSSV